MKRGKFVACRNKMLSLGFTSKQAEIICGTHFFDEEKSESETYEEDTEYDQECVSRKISIFKSEHPNWSKDHVVAAAIGYCRQHQRKDAETKMTKTSSIAPNISTTHLISLVKEIKKRKGLKVGGMGFFPFKIELPMKNLNRLQTKLEKLFTLEQKWLTMEELLKRNRYMTIIQKSDSEDDSLGDLLHDFIISFTSNYPEIQPELVLHSLITDGNIKQDSYFVNSTTELEKINAGMNNIIKAPVVLAREMITEYEDGKVKHFKPYKELIMAIEGIDKIPIVIEHQSHITERNTVGYVKEFKADSEMRAIKGMVYLYESKLPKVVISMLKSGIVVPVSIGFLCQLGDAGTWEGQEYHNSQENIILEHLAICIESTPRCATGYCGINLDSQKSTEDDNFTFINKNDYLVNICKLFKKNDNSMTDLHNEDAMVSLPIDQSGKIAGFEPKDIEAILTKLRKFMAGKPIENAHETVDRIIKALTDSENKMDENQKKLQDALTQKEEQLKDALQNLEDAKAEITDLKEKTRNRLMDSIKNFSNKYGDEELQEMSIEKLEIIEDASSRFAPSYEKPEDDAVLPTGAQPKKKKQDSKEKGMKRIDPRKLHQEVNEKYNLRGLM